jgi:hypothetical protein
MMGEFFKMGNYSFCSDERDIRTSNNWLEIRSWCADNLIAAEQIMTGPGMPFNVWRVKDEHQRTWFKLRWEI